MSTLSRVLLPLVVCALTLTPGIKTGKAEPEIILPDFGDPSDALISPSEDRELGAAFFRDLHGRLKINQDPEIQSFIQSLGHRLSANSDNPQHPYFFFVVLEPSINAFAGPGGYIGIHSGLILVSETESELSSVIAHEIAHITQRHLYRAFDAASRLSLPTAAAMLAAILIGTQSPELGSAALIAAQAGNIQAQINFTRDNEQEADRIGMQTLARSDFDPRSMPTFFERLQQSSRFYGKGPPEFLRTHPVTTSRISDTRGRANAYPYRQSSDSMTYLLIKAKIRVLSEEKPEQTIKQFSALLDQGTTDQQAANRYGLALAHLANRNFASARAQLRSLIQQYPRISHFASALAKTELESKNYDTALKYYAKAMEEFPDNDAVTLDYVQTLLKANKPAKAQKIISRYNRSHTPALLTYELLAQAYGDLGKKAESHRYVAEYYYLSGNTHAAIVQTKIALKNVKGSFYLNAILEERLKKFMTEEKLRKQK